MSELRAALAEALGPIYRIEREVRPVGNCRLFVALGSPTEAELLVKVLPAELSLAVDPAAFEREALLLADRLGHALLVAPRGAGGGGAFVYHTRRFVEGTTLRASLDRYGELPLRRAAEILRDSLTALAHAHTAGIVHGDLKPENVLLASGRALVADTGIVEALGRALARGAASGAGAAGAASAALGNAAYVAPERRGGGAPAGPRDDMFAVGVLVHEMLTGRPPTPRGEALEEVRSVPAWLGGIVRRCLAAEPAVRWANAGAALAAMSRPGGAAA